MSISGEATVEAIWCADTGSFEIVMIPERVDDLEKLIPFRMESLLLSEDVVIFNHIGEHEKLPENSRINALLENFEVNANLGQCDVRKARIFGPALIVGADHKRGKLRKISQSLVTACGRFGDVEKHGLILGPGRDSGWARS